MAYHQLRIAKIVQETPDARSFVLDVPADLADQFRYRAGQFLTFRVPHDAGAFNRCYSLSSAPETDGPTQGDGETRRPAARAPTGSTTR